MENLTYPLTKATALPIIQKAFEEKRLAAQNDGKVCAYRSEAGPCVIGCLIDDATAAKWDRHFQDGFYISADLDVIMREYPESRELLSYEDRKWFCDVQVLHDRWCQINKDGLFQDDHETLFKAAIYAGAQQ